MFGSSDGRFCMRVCVCAYACGFVDAFRLPHLKKHNSPDCLVAVVAVSVVVVVVGVVAVVVVVGATYYIAY